MTLWSSVSKSRLSTFKQSLREGSTVISSTTSLKRSLYNGSNSLAHNLRARATTHRRVTKLWACRQPTQKEVETLLHLRKLLRTQYSEQSHGRLLRRLWNSTHPGGVLVDPICIIDQQSSKPGCTYSRITMEWRALGFQRDDPAIDLRGGGLLALQCLLYFCEMHREDALRLISSQKYSWAIVGVNLTHLLMELLGVCGGKEGSPSKGQNLSSNSYADHLQRARHSYWQLFQNMAGFFELFCHSFKLLDLCWAELNATEMEFHRVLEMTRKKLLRGLKNPSHLAEVYKRVADPLAEEWVRHESLGPSECSPQIWSDWSREELILVSKIKQSDRMKVAEERKQFRTKHSRFGKESLFAEAEDLLRTRRDSGQRMVDVRLSVGIDDSCISRDSFSAENGDFYYVDGIRDSTSSASSAFSAAYSCSSSVSIFEFRPSMEESMEAMMCVPVGE